MKKTILMMAVVLMASSASADRGGDVVAVALSPSLAVSFSTWVSSGPQIRKEIVAARPYAAQVLIDGEASQETAAVLARIRVEIPETAQWNDLELSQAIVEFGQE